MNTNPKDGRWPVTHPSNSINSTHTRAGLAILALSIGPMELGQKES
jgi:hypothetical protein